MGKGLKTELRELAPLKTEVKARKKTVSLARNKGGRNRGFKIVFTVKILLQVKLGMTALIKQA